MCNFSINFASTPDELVNKLSDAITSQGGSFTGDTNSGNFSVRTPLGNIAGHYTIVDTTVNVVIDHKPGLVSCRQIENYVRNFLS
jgi:hypothetical protein